MATNRKTSKAPIAELLQEAEIGIEQTLETQGGELHELEPSGFGGRKALVFQHKEQGVTFSLRVEMPESNPQFGQPITSEKSLALLGALNLSFQSRNIGAQLIGGRQGLEAIMLSIRVCDGGLDGSSISRHLERLQQYANDLEAVLRSNRGNIQDVLERIRPQSAFLHPELPELRTKIVPSFNPQVRDELLNQK